MCDGRLGRTGEGYVLLGTRLLGYVGLNPNKDGRMRVQLKAHLDTRKVNEANQDGTLPERLGEMMDQLQREAAYFYPENGKRTVLLVFDMEDPSQIPPTVEPLFQGAEASVSITPVMNRDDLQSGLQEALGLGKRQLGIPGGPTISTPYSAATAMKRSASGGSLGGGGRVRSCAGSPTV